MTPLCTGIILNNRMVLTSATCVIKAQSVYPHVSNLQVVAGAQDFDDPTNQISTVSSIQTPTMFSQKRPIGHDLAILTLEQPFHLDQCGVMPISLPYKNYAPKGAQIKMKISQ